jgi:hypothetical protein
VEELLKFTPNLYLQMKQAYPTTYLLQRDIFENKRAKAEYENAEIKWDDSKNQLSATYTMRGLAVYKGDHVELALADKDADVTLSTVTGTTVILSASIPLANNGRMMQTATVMLPSEASDIKFSEGVISYDMPAPSSGSGGLGLLFLILAIVSLVGITLSNLIPLLMHGHAQLSGASAAPRRAARKK